MSYNEEETEEKEPGEGEFGDDILDMPPEGMDFGDELDPDADK